MPADEWGGCKIDWSAELPDFLDERSSLIERVRAGDMMLWRAEQVAAENGFLPLAPEPDPSSLDARGIPNWTIEMVIAWMAWRDPLRVAHFCRPLHREMFPIKSPFDSIPAPNLSGIQEALDDAATVNEQELGDTMNFEKLLAELLEVLQSGSITADGIKLRTMDTETISPRDWVRLRPIAGDGGETLMVNSLGVCVYGDILFDPREVLREWPELGKPGLQQGKRGRPPAFDWESFEKEAFRKIDDMGDFNPAVDNKWNQAALERYMADWCDKHWKDQRRPAESTIRNRISAVYEAFLESRR